MRKTKKTITPLSKKMAHSLNPSEMIHDDTNEWDDIEQIIPLITKTIQYIRIGGSEAQKTIRINERMLDLVQENAQFNYCNIFYSKTKNTLLFNFSEKLTSHGFKMTRAAKSKSVAISADQIFQWYKGILDYNSCTGLYKPDLVVINDQKHLAVFLDKKL